MFILYVRVEGNGLELFSVSFSILILFYILFSNLESEVSIYDSYKIVTQCNTVSYIGHISYVTVTQLYVTQKNIEDSRIIMLFYILIVYNMYNLQNRLRLV